MRCRVKVAKLLTRLPRGKFNLIEFSLRGGSYSHTLESDYHRIKTLARSEVLFEPFFRRKINYFILTDYMLYV